MNHPHFSTGIHHVELFMFRLYRRFGQDSWARARTLSEVRGYDPTLIAAPDTFEIKVGILADEDLECMNVILNVGVSRWGVRSDGIHTTFYIQDPLEYALVCLARA